MQLSSQWADGGVGGWVREWGGMGIEVCKKVRVCGRIGQEGEGEEGWVDG